MPTTKQRLIAELLDEKEAPTDHSLRKKAWDRAQSGKPPKTMTPWEWEQWYAEHGVPVAHREVDSGRPAASRWSRFIERIWRRTTS